MPLNGLTFGLIGAGAVIAGAGLILLFVQLFLLLRRRMCMPILPCTWSRSLELPTSKEPSKNSCRLFTFKQIEECCEGFSNLIGETPSHNVYKGILADGTEIAVKRAKKYPPDQLLVERNFQFQVDFFSKMFHPNLTNLIGYCDEKHHKMLVFQYAPNGTLYNNLHNDDEPLSWKQRMRVAIGTASAVSYLHQLNGSCIIHGDLTSHNVLLSEDYSAKVCGVRTPTYFMKTTAPKSYQVCVDSDVNRNEKEGPSDDVYTFGVLLLELVSGKSAFSKESGMIVEWAGQFLQSRDQMTILADPTLKNIVPLELYSVCEIARLCIQQESASRPRMEEVLYMLVQSLGMEPEAPAALQAAAAQPNGTTAN